MLKLTDTSLVSVTFSTNPTTTLFALILAVSRVNVPVFTVVAVASTVALA